MHETASNLANCYSWPVALVLLCLLYYIAKFAINIQVRLPQRTLPFVPQIDQLQSYYHKILHLT